MFDSVYSDLTPARDEARDYLESEGHKPRIFALSNLLTFFSNIPIVTKLIGEEPEILFFAVAQWVVIALAYMAWTQMLHWIPDSVWQAVHEASQRGEKDPYALVNLALLAWSFFIVVVASYPIGLCTSAMVAVHDLRIKGEKVTLAKCIAIADCHLVRIWMFTALDSWITVSAILDRLPKKHYHRTALDELLYYAWKVSTMGVVPALVNGRGFVAAGKDSVKLLTSQPSRALGLRLGYSAVCWVIGILSYIGAIFVFAHFGDKGQGPHYIYSFYFLMAGPIFVSVGIISVLVRPFFLLSVAKFYTDMVDVTAEIEKDIASIPSWEKFLFSWKTGLFMAMLVALLVAVFSGDRLGIAAWINHLAQKDLLHYQLRQ